MRSFLPLSAFAASVALVACAGPAVAPAAVPVFFQNASVMLSAEAQQAVAKAAHVAQDNPTLRIRLVGYGLPSSVMMEPVRMSADRAKAVQDELIKDGVDQKRIYDYAGGALQPAGDTPVASRRVDISFVR